MGRESRESKKRRLTEFPKGFSKPRPGTLGKMWQQTFQDDQAPQGTDSWLVAEKPRQDVPQAPSGPTSPAQPERAAAQQPDWRTLPSLPKWPPLPNEDPFGARRDNGDTTLGGSDAQPAPPLWNAPDRDRSDFPDHIPNQPTRRLWRRLRPASRRMKVALAAAIVGVFVLCSSLGVFALGNFLNAGTPGTGSLTFPGSNTGGQTQPTLSAGATVGAGTPTASVSGTVTPAAPTATAVPTLAVTFTCASGVAGGKGEVCVHTQPNATLTISVRYCDGNDAGGKSLRGAAHADNNGDYSWQWDVHTSCIGQATATVTSKAGGATITQSTTFAITR